MAATLLIALALAGPVAGLSWHGGTASEVVLDAPGAEDPEEMIALFGIREGDAVTRTRVRAGVQALLASGRVEDVVVRLQPDGARTRLLLQVQVASRVRSVTIEGLPPRLHRRVSDVLRLRVGAPLKVPEFETAVAEAVALLRDGGHPGATLDPDLVFDHITGTVAVRLEADLGPGLKVAAVRVEGVEVSDAEASEITGLRAGDIASSGVLNRARRRLSEALRTRGLWEAEVDAPVRQVTGSTATVVFRVVPGPSWKLKVEGYARSRSFEQEALPFLRGEEPFDEAALDHAVHAVRTFLQRRGHLLARVEGAVLGEGGERELRLRIEAGPVVPIVDVRFPGADGVATEELATRVGARPGRPWRWGREPVDEQTLAADAESVLAVVRDAGFAGATVDTPRVLPESGGVAIEFPVTEGERMTVSEIAVSGVPDEVPRPALPLEAGGPWSQGRERAAVDALVFALRTEGYASARARSSHDCEEGRCRVTLTVEPGIRSVLDRIVIAGLARTGADVVEKVAALPEGEAIGPEETLAAQRRLLALGAFDRVAIRPVPGHEALPRRDLVIEVSEARTRALSFGLGWDNVEKVRGSFSWSELNLFGRARSLHLELRASDREQHAQLIYREPARLGLFGFPTWVSAYRTEERYTNFLLHRHGTWVEVGDRQRRPFRALLRFEYQIQRADAEDSVLSELERHQQSLAIASFTPILELDTRDDLFTPRRGVLASLQLQSAFRVFLADTDFDKLTLALAGYQPLGPGVLAGSLRMGAVRPRDECSGTADNICLPLGVRLFAGGRISHRAFPTDLLGAEGTLDVAGDAVRPKGGASMMLANLEWRFPLYNVIGGSLFVDGGNVWPQWNDLPLDDLRWGAGAGLRVETPVGPLRLEYGWKLDRRELESRGELFLSFGNAF